MRKKELLDLAWSMDIEPNYEKFYRFAQNYAAHLTQEKKEDSALLFQCLEYCRNKPKVVRNRVGINGKQTDSLVSWCKDVLEKRTLRKLTLTELNYVFACCARYCKAKTR